MSTYQDEIKELRKHFLRIDKTDPEALRRWFESHSHLRTADHAIIAQRSTNYIRELKKLAGLGGKPVKKRPTRRIRKVDNVVLPEDWDTKEFLEKAVQLYSVKAISRAAGVSTRTLYRRIDKYGITKKTHKEACKANNPFCTKEWVYEHYVTQGLSQSKCAKLAGITTAAFTKWLVRFEIPVRTARETFAKQKDIKVWARKLFDKLCEQPVVRKCYLRQDHIHVRFHNYYWETYYPDKCIKRGKGNRIPRSFTITQEQSMLDNVPAVLPQYEADFGEEAHQAHIVIPMKQWKKASFIEKRLAVHEFARQIVTRGWIDPDYPEWVLTEEWEKLRNLNPAKYLRKSTFTAFPSYGKQPPPGRRLTEHFFDLSELWDIIKSPRWTVKALNHMTKQDLRVYDTHNFYRTVMATSDKKVPRVIDPGFYSIVLKRLGIRGRVLDLTPNHGNRAVACALNGLTYVTEPNQKVRKAIDRGFADYVGLNYEEYDGGTVDLVILDNDLRKCDIDIAMQYASKAKKMMVFTPRGEKNTIQAKYKPSSMISVKARCFGKTTDFISLW